MDTPAAVATMFFAYPSRPADLTETIENAASQVTAGGLVQVTTWRHPPVTGRLILDAITQAIDQANVFGCDLTHLNDNVLFELGYSIGRDKSIWISLNSTIESATKDYRNVGVLEPVGYAAYSNQAALVNALYRDQPWARKGFDISEIGLYGSGGRRKRPRVLYLKSSIDTDASIAVSDELDGTSVFRDVLLDDPNEVPFQSLDWYVQGIRSSDAVIAHLLSDNHTGAKLHNAKCSLICGVGLGMSKPVLMLAHAPYECPLDFRTLLQVHDRAGKARTFLHGWLTEQGPSLAEAASRADAQRISAARSHDLLRLNLGDSVAENESDALEDYFLENDAYTRALYGQQSIFVGRKGTGKTANFYALSKELGRERANHVCVIKPIGYEVEGVLRMLRQSVDRAERGFLVESMWKLLIYTELAASVARELKAKPAYYQYSEGERELLAFVQGHTDLIEQSFSVRLQNAVESLVGIDGYGAGREQRVRVSEVLHERILKDLRVHLNRALEGKARVAILVDNLDKAWGPREDVNQLSALIFGLLGVSGRILNEFRVESTSRTALNLTLSIFLRSDIFSIVQDVSRERDKISYDRLAWDDRETLLRVLDRRLAYSFDESVTSQEVWERHFAETVGDFGSREFLVSTVVPRPRDLIFLVREAIGEAVNRGHSRVEEADFLSAARKYSEYALSALVVEDDPRLGKLEAILYEFAGSSATLERSQVKATLRGAGAVGDQVERYLEVLCDLNFLGIETSDGNYEYPTDEGRRKVLQTVASKIAARRGGEESYRIHRAFWPVLQAIEA